ncbi:MAG TPA: hypothetical protein VM242_13580 [Acidimicrobiales bacterium]|nr:hypothetical protein [Acidimicrobiales bacterium]
MVLGLFRRQAVVDAAGWDTNTVGEDAELVLRLHRTRREQGKACRITFFPDLIWLDRSARRLEDAHPTAKTAGSGG